MKRVFTLFFITTLMVTQLFTTESDSKPKKKKWTQPEESRILLSVSRLASGSFFKEGESPTIKVVLKDTQGKPLVPSDFATLNLYLYGPEDQSKTRTAVEMLNAETDRSKRPHHYIDLLTNPGVEVDGNVLRYKLNPVTNEEPGTYTATVWAILKADGLMQAMKITNLQIKTAMVEKPVVEKTKCAACHEGASSGKTYFRHIDSRGNWALDYMPVATCKSCHNQEGYAAYRDSASPTGRTPDPIVRRVHGVHMGEELKNPFNTDPTTGDFRDYTSVVFPAGIKNCTVCHVDDRWKTKPSRGACGACHENIVFSEIDNAGLPVPLRGHLGGPQNDDTGCSSCHPPDEGGVISVAEAHKIQPPAFTHTVELTMSPPANRKFYVAGEAPVVTITIKNAATGAIIDPNTMMEPVDSKNIKPGEFRRANLYVSGPRDYTNPVLTTKASQSGPTASSYANNDLRVLKDPAKADPKITRTATSTVYQLDDVKDLEPGTYTVFVETLPPAPNIGGWALLNFQVGTQTAEKKVATNCIDCHRNTTMHTSYFAVEFNPDICKSCHDYKRQIEGKSGWLASNNGFGAAPLARRVHGVHYGRYLDKPGEVHQVYDFSEVIFPQDVRNCTKCHSESDNWKEYPSRLACLSCHDSTEATEHADRMTLLDPTPDDRWNGDEVEMCVYCHGPGEFKAVENVHNIRNPFKPPYPREP